MHIEALEGGTSLSGVDERAPEQVARDFLGVHIGQHNARVITAQLESEASQAIRGGAHNRLTGLG